MKGLILGAGYGVRLYPLTKNIPKPLLAIAGKPVIEWTLEKLKAIKELDEIFIVVNQHYYATYIRWLADYKFPKKISLINDGSSSPDDRLGAVRDIQFVIEKAKIHDDLLIIAGDNLFDISLTAFVSFYKECGASIALKDLSHLSQEIISQYGIVTLDKANKVIDFEEKPPMPKSTLAALCLYLFSKDEIKLIKKYLDSGFNPDAPGYYIQWCYKKLDLYGFVMKGEWFDIGDIDSYNKAQDFYTQKVKC
jgi:glucose-1-phosphate thymidylyltransferase